jgi:hypothetical protein
MDEFHDEHSGRGGSYVIGADGKRVLQERTSLVAPEQPAADAKSKPTVKGDGNGKSN